MIGGWIKGHRKRFKNPLFTRPYCPGYAWEWLCASAAIEPTKFNIKGKTVTVNRGQFAISYSRLEAQFGWSRSVCQRFVTRLKTDTMIEVSTDTGQMIITICNYEEYQSIEVITDTGKNGLAIRNRYGTDTQKKKGKKVEEEEEEDILPELDLESEPLPKQSPFDLWYETYPLKKGKGQARVAMNGALKKTTIEALVSATEKYAAECRSKGIKMKYPATWLNGECWLDEELNDPASDLSREIQDMRERGGYA